MEVAGEVVGVQKLHWAEAEVRSNVLNVLFSLCCNCYWCGLRDVADYICFGFDTYIMSSAEDLDDTIRRCWRYVSYPVCLFFFYCMYCMNL